MPHTQFTNLDFDQIKTQIKSYLRANSNFTDFDFDGSNFSILIDTLAYNTYITAFNSNMVVNESFLDSATVRENIVSLARNICYVPRSRTAARASVWFKIPITHTVGSEPSTATLRAGLVCVGATNDTTSRFSVSEDVTTTFTSETSTTGYAQFGSATQPLTVYQGNFLEKEWTVDASTDQRFIIENPNVDTSTLAVYVSNDVGTLGREYSKVDNILKLDKNSEIYLIQEVQDEKYELFFGDGYFGKKLENGAKITVRYIVTDGIGGNGAENFAFQGNLTKDGGNIRIIPNGSVNITTVTVSYTHLTLPTILLV